MTELRRTPLYDLHTELGARMVPFAGWEMPVQYPMGVLGEHLHTRKAAGLFDVSHMGQVILRGENAARALETLVPADIEGLSPGRQRYGLFTNEQGGILDDLMIASKTGAGGDHLFLVDGRGIQRIDCTSQPLPYGPRLIRDVLDRTETAMAQAHCFLATELALTAQSRAVRVDRG